MPTPESPGPGRLIIGGAFVVIGALILIPSGLCSTLMGFVAIARLVTDAHGFVRDLVQVWPFAAAVVGVAAVGGILIRVGLAIRGRY